MDNKWKIGFIPIGFASNERALDTLSRLGYSGVEFLWGFGGSTNLHSATEVSNTAKLASKYGMKITDIHCGEDFVTLDENVRKERTRLVQSKIETVRAAGIDMINQFTGPAYWNATPLKLGRDIKEGRAWSGVIESFNDIISTAEKNDMYV
ncbi:MAG: sugar phosphate isomerase/epimerase family protein, partial [Nitrososphaerales archaeon]